MIDKLPNLPSELVTFALQHLKIVEADEHVKIDMFCWVKVPQTALTNEQYNFDSGVCQVCLAGAVMLGVFRDQTKQAFDANKKYRQTVIPYELLSFGVSESDYDKLSALNFLRVGYLSDAYTTLKRKRPDSMLPLRTVTAYEVNKERFYEDMESLVDYLKKFGE